MKGQIKKNYKKKLLSRLTRKISKRETTISRGYIVGFSENFVILQETDDFRFLGYSLFKTAAIEKIRCHENDEFYDKIMKSEGLKKKISLSSEILLESWVEVFKSLKKNGKNIIVECEKQDLFIIGEIVKVSKKAVFIRYFNAEGVFDEEPTKIGFKDITKVTFNDRYIEIFSKYLTERNDVTEC